MNQNNPVSITPIDESKSLVWEDSSHLTINNLHFYLSTNTQELQTASSQENQYLLGKPREMVQDAFILKQEEKINKIFEMSILQGGSVVLYDQIFQPEKIAAIDFQQRPVSALTSYITQYGKTDIVKPYYGVNQADRSAMEKILSTEFPNRDIDLIIDDASHFYEETREAFNIAFPFLKKGGLYIIEDWAWAHWSGEYWQNGRTPGLAGKKALSNLLTELFMLTASCPSFIKDINIGPSVIKIRRNSGELPQGKFNISEHYLLRGRKFQPQL